ncbi:MFS transporter [Colwellia sp. 1_MG-2023]|uniref:MFS transporter n=1 Tax=unclassified Colwellia TaxID=196834 RepID=UPI001C0A4733|nr:MULTISPECIES: MFS transporter [unclassified Colwellia]MBU2924841.1 MFS transporter [Colwellia sp. C2M11]MDO6654075.1 MFS transporter [Colwellia sp. 3_MG-2023]MDO6665493.1 MFS transporter [Colwellia sp. 2_MG-2023]MDO6689748.1 MFS transporter [Colwellia sp. 1_MG-2023]
MTGIDKNVAFYSLVAAFGGFVFGLDAANISGAIRFISSLFELTSEQTGTVAGIALIGVIFALFITGTLCERFGRKKVLLAIAITYSLSTILSAFAINYEMLVVGRFIGGVAFASITVSAMYIGEIAPADKRGKYVSANQLMIAIGLLLAFLINYFLIKAMDDIQWLTNENIWRYMLGAELIANAVWITLILFIPESPRWLIMKGRSDEAQAILIKTVAENQINDIISDVEESVSSQEKNNTFTQLKILFSKKMRFVLSLAIVYAIVQGATGMNAVLFFAPLVFEQVGMSVQDTFLQTVIMGLVGVVSTIFAISFVEKLGRRFLTLAGLFLVVVAHGSTWFGFSQANYVFDEKTFVAIEQDLSQQNINISRLAPLMGKTYSTDVELKAELAKIFSNKELPLLSGTVINSSIQGINVPMVLFGIFAFLAAFNISIGPILWVIFSEIFPNNVRSVALPFAALVQTISSWSVSEFFPWQLEHLGVSTIFFIYGVIGLVGLIIMSFMLPETKGKTIEAIEKELVTS